MSSNFFCREFGMLCSIGSINSLTFRSFSLYVLIFMMGFKIYTLTSSYMWGQGHASLPSTPFCVPRKVFLDVGSNEGQTLAEVATSENPYQFNQVHAFEPSTKHLNRIQQNFGNLSFVFIHNFGLSNVTETGRVLYSSGHVGASLIQDIEPELPNHEESIKVVSAADWIISNLDPDCDHIFVKINCEGCELWVLPSLVDSNIFHKLRWVHLDFDVRKHTTTAAFETSLRSLVSNFSNWEDPDKMVGSNHTSRIRSWLCHRPQYFPNRCKY